MVISSDIVIAINYQHKSSPKTSTRINGQDFLWKSRQCLVILCYYKFIWVLLKDELYKNNMWYIKYKVFFIKSIKV